MNDCSAIRIIEFFFGAGEVDYLFEPRLIEANDSRIQVMLPFQQMSGRCKLKIGKAKVEPAIDFVMVIDGPELVLTTKRKGQRR